MTPCTTACAWPFCGTSISPIGAVACRDEPAAARLRLRQVGDDPHHSALMRIGSGLPPNEASSLRSRTQRAIDLPVRLVPHRGVRKLSPDCRGQNDGGRHQARSSDPLPSKGAYYQINPHSSRMPSAGYYQMTEHRRKGWCSDGSGKHRRAPRCGIRCGDKLHPHDRAGHQPVASAHDRRHVDPQVRSKNPT
jgi:hypothetical protein